MDRCRHDDVAFFRTGRGRACALALAVFAWLAYGSGQRTALGARADADAHAATVNAGMWPLTMLGSDDGGAGLGAPERLDIPNKGSHWTSPSPMQTSGFVVAWARLNEMAAATAVGAVSKDGKTWTEVTRASANAYRSVPHLNLVLPVPAGYRFRLTLEGARGGGLELVQSSGGHWFPLGASGS